MRQKMKVLTMNRLWRVSFVPTAKMPTNANAAKLRPPINYLDRSELGTSWNHKLSNIHISSSIPQLDLGVTDATTETLTEAMVTDVYPLETWTHV